MVCPAALTLVMIGVGNSVVRSQPFLIMSTVMVAAGANFQMVARGTRIRNCDLPQLSEADPQQCDVEYLIGAGPNRDAVESIGWALVFVGTLVALAQLFV